MENIFHAVLFIFRLEIVKLLPAVASVSIVKVDNLINLILWIVKFDLNFQMAVF